MALRNLGPGYQGYPIGGTDKHIGRHLAYFTIKIGAETRTFAAWSRISASGSVDVRETTNPGSGVKTYQPMREEPPTFEIEINLPYAEDDDGGNFGAKSTVKFLLAGKVIDEFDIKGHVGAGIFPSDHLESYGKWIIERSSIESSRDDLTNVRITVRALGYTNAENIPDYYDGDSGSV